MWTDEDILAMEEKAYDRLIGPLFGPKLAGPDRLTAHFRSHNPLDQAKDRSVDDLKKVRYYIDCGDDDFLIKANMALCAVLVGVVTTCWCCVFECRKLSRSSPTPIRWQARLL